MRFAHPIAVFSLCALCPNPAAVAQAPPGDESAPREAQRPRAEGQPARAAPSPDDAATPEAPSPPARPTPANGLQPPRLREGVTPEWDRTLVEAGSRIEVILTITISPEGAVSDAQIAQSGGEALDQAALAAAPRLRFDPATRDGEPIPARIRYRFVFERPAEPPPPTTGTLAGQVFAAGEVLAGARVSITLAEPEDAPNRTATTDAQGAFQFDDLPAGNYQLEIAGTGFESLTRLEEVVAGEALEVRYRLDREQAAAADDEDLPEFGATAVVDRPRREATRRTLEREVLTSVPGTRGDALRVVELLPGVGRPPFGTGQLFIRGAAPGDSEVFVDGVPVPLLYHFGGLTSFYQSRLLQRIDFVPGNFGVRYGRRIGGILEVHPRDPNDDGNVHGMVDVNLLDASVVLEVPLWEGASLALAARRSYIDFFFAEVLPDDTFDVIAAPVYYDYQLVFTWKFSPRDRLRILGYGSSDEFRTIANNEDFSRPFSLELSTQFHRIQATWEHRFDDRFRQEILVNAGWTGLVLQAGENFGFNSDFVPIGFRSEWEVLLHERVKMRWGIDWSYTPTDLSFAGPAPTQSEGTPDQSDPNAPDASADFNQAAYRPAVYLESSLSPIDELTLVVGARVDYFRDIEAWTLDPRATARLKVAPAWTLKTGVGLFSQPPEFQESAPGLGNPELEPIRSIHTSAGVEYAYDETWQFDLEGYYKHIWNRVTGTPQGLAPFFTNDGQGRIYGAELSIRALANTNYPIYGFLSYTLSRSERQDRNEPWRAFDFDQTHILSVATVWRIGDGWELGGTFRLVSGNPFTPIVASIYDVRADVYRPLYGEINSQRYSPFQRLDVRLQKTWRIDDLVMITAYIDVQNVYNAMNREATAYSYDYSESTEINGLPILPTIGVRGEL